MRNLIFILYFKLFNQTQHLRYPTKVIFPFQQTWSFQILGHNMFRWLLKPRFYSKWYNTDLNSATFLSELFYFLSNLWLYKKNQLVLREVFEDSAAEDTEQEESSAEVFEEWHSRASYNWPWIWCIYKGTICIIVFNFADAITFQLRFKKRFVKSLVLIHFVHACHVVYAVQVTTEVDSVFQTG